jgi:hypothetical protein
VVCTAILDLGGDTIPPETGRRFVTTMWLIEDAVMMLCAPWRSNSHYAEPITKSSKLARDQEVWKLVRRHSEIATDIRML